MGSKEHHEEIKKNQDDGSEDSSVLQNPFWKPNVDLKDSVADVPVLDV